MTSHFVPVGREQSTCFSNITSHAFATSSIRALLRLSSFSKKDPPKACRCMQAPICFSSLHVATFPHIVAPQNLHLLFLCPPFFGFVPPFQIIVVETSLDCHGAPCLFASGPADAFGSPSDAVIVELPMAFLRHS